MAIRSLEWYKARQRIAELVTNPHGCSAEAMDDQLAVLEQQFDAAMVDRNEQIGQMQRAVKGLQVEANALLNRQIDLSIEASRLIGEGVVDNNPKALSFFQEITTGSTDIEPPIEAPELSLVPAEPHSREIDMKDPLTDTSDGETDEPSPPEAQPALPPDVRDDGVYVPPEDEGDGGGF